MVKKGQKEGQKEGGGEMRKGRECGAPRQERTRSCLLMPNSILEQNLLPRAAHVLQATLKCCQHPGPPPHPHWPQALHKRKLQGATGLWEGGERAACKAPPLPPLHPTQALSSCPSVPFLAAPGSGIETDTALGRQKMYGPRGREGGAGGCERRGRETA